MIEIRALQFAYPGGAFRLHIPSFQVQEGEKLAVIGPSGSGKTTLLNLVSGIITTSKGEVRVAGADIGALSDARRRAFRIRHIGFIFQDFELLDYLNVLDNILHPYRITGALRLESTVRKLEGILRDHPATWMIWEGKPAQETIERLRSLGVESVVVNPSGNRPSPGDFLNVMANNARSLHLVFGQLSGDP